MVEVLHDEGRKEMGMTVRSIAGRLANVRLMTALLLVLWMVVGCGGSSGQKEDQQEPNQQAAQPIPPAQSSNRAVSGLIGTWDLTSAKIAGNPFPASGYQTFSEDGTLQATATEAVLGDLGLEIEDPEQAIITTTNKYSVLDDSRIEITPEGATESYVQEYSLEGDTLTFYTPDPEYPVENTYQRRS